jgi:hypothetical protein
MTGATFEGRALEQVVKAVNSVADQLKIAVLAKYGITKFREAPSGDPVLEEIVRGHMLAGGIGDFPAFHKRLVDRLAAMGVLSAGGGAA